MIRAEGLHKRYGEVRAVDGVSFTAPDGKVTGLLGPNGAGKTSVMRMLFGIVRPDAGKAWVDNILVQDEPLAACARLGALPDASGIYPRLTARENLRYFGELHGIGGARLHARVEELVERLGLREVADRRAQGFSQGERMKVALGRALVHDPRHVILDEPTNGLDVMTTRAVRGLIRTLRDEGRCVLFSSHVMQEVSALCDHVVIIAHGKVVADGALPELLTQTGAGSLEDAFVALTHTGSEGPTDPDRGLR